MSEIYDETAVEFNFTIRNSETAEKVEVRQVAFGMYPMVMVQPTYNEDTGRVTVAVDTTDLSADDAIDMFENVIAVMRENIDGLRKMSEDVGFDD